MKDKSKIKFIIFENVQSSLIIFFLIVFALFLIKPNISLGSEIGVTDDTIKIGTFAPFSGRAALYGKIDHSVQIVYKYINEQGGINGRKLEIITEDTTCDPKGAIAAVKKLIHEDKVFMLHGGNCSNAILAAKEEIVKSGIPFMIQGATLGKLTYPVEKNIFTAILTSDEIASSVTNFSLSKPGIEKIAVIKHTDPWGMALYNPTIKILKDAGVTPILDLDMPSKATDATSILLRLKKSDPEIVILWAYPAETTVFLKGMNKLGMNIFTVGRSTNPLEVYEKTGSWEASENYGANNAFRVNFDAPEFSKWTKLLNKYYPKDKPDSLAFLCTAGALAVVEALERSGRDLTREKFIDELENLKNFETGITHPVNFSPTDHRGLDRGAVNILIKENATVDQKIVDDWNSFTKFRPEYK